jgi:hypothetical protein
MNPQAIHLAMGFEAVQPRDRLRVQQLPFHPRARPCKARSFQMIERSAGRSTDAEPTSYSRGVLADVQQRHDDVIGV